MEGSHHTDNNHGKDLPTLELTGAAGDDTIFTATGGQHHLVALRTWIHQLQKECRAMDNAATDESGDKVRETDCLAS